MGQNAFWCRVKQSYDFRKSGAVPSPSCLLQPDDRIFFCHWAQRLIPELENSGNLDPTGKGSVTHSYQDLQWSYQWFFPWYGGRNRSWEHPELAGEVAQVRGWVAPEGKSSEYCCMVPSLNGIPVQWGTWGACFQPSLGRAMSKNGLCLGREL